MSKTTGQSIASSMVYKSLERYSLLAFQTIVQIVIARILSPNDYGLVAMMTVFISIANVFIHNGFNSAIIQKKEADPRDFGTALLINFLIGLLLYIILFIASPAIARFYNEPQLKLCLRILALILPIGAISSIQSAIAVRRMMFRNLFICNVVGGVISGIIGILAALWGAGYWALICQQISSVVIIAIALTYHATWKPSFCYDSRSAKEQFEFGWKMLGAGLINTIYNELNSLFIGKKYTASDLSFYTKGRTLPNMFVSGVDSALQSVTLSAFSRKQTDYSYLRQLLKKTITTNSYILIPVLMFLGVCGDTIVKVLLTEKWLPMVPYMQICCFTYAFHPIASIDMQVVASIGRSDLRLKLEFVKKPFGILLLILAIPYGPLAIAISAAITSLFSLLIGAIVCQKFVQYSVWQHFRDVLPIILCTSLAGVLTWIMGLINLSAIIKLLLQGIVMFGVYLPVTVLFKVPGHYYIFDFLKKSIIKH